MNWLIFAIGAVILFSFLNILQRVLAIDSTHPRALALLFNATAGLIAIALFLITNDGAPPQLPQEPIAWVAMGIAAFCYAMFERGRFYAAQLLDASVLITIMNITALVSFTGSLIIYNETLTTSKLVGAFFIICALFLVSIEKNMKAKPTKGIAIAISISIMLGIANMLDKAGALYFNPSTYQILVWTIPIIFIALPFPKIEVIKTELQQSSWRLLILAFINVLGYLLSLKALELTEATNVIPIIQTSTILTVLLGITLLKEKDRIPQKILASILALAGTYFLL